MSEMIQRMKRRVYTDAFQKLLTQKSKSRGYFLARFNEIVETLCKFGDFIDNSCKQDLTIETANEGKCQCVVVDFVNMIHEAVSHCVFFTTWSLFLQQVKKTGITNEYKTTDCLQTHTTAFERMLHALFKTEMTDLQTAVWEWVQFGKEALSIICYSLESGKDFWFNNLSESELHQFGSNNCTYLLLLKIAKCCCSPEQVFQCMERFEAHFDMDCYIEQPLSGANCDLSESRWLALDISFKATHLLPSCFQELRIAFEESRQLKHQQMRSVLALPFDVCSLIIEYDERPREIDTHITPCLNKERSFSVA
jgi:hypothetical protein